MIYPVRWVGKNNQAVTSSSGATTRERGKEKQKGKQKKRYMRAPYSKRAHKVARKHVSSSLPPRIVQQLPAPPPILGRVRHRDDIPRLEIKLFVDRRRVVVERLDCTPRDSVISNAHKTRHNKETHRKTRSDDHRPHTPPSAEAARATPQAMATVQSPDSSIETPWYFPGTSAASHSSPRVPRSDSADGTQVAPPIHSRCCCNWIAAEGRPAHRSSARDTRRCSPDAAEVGGRNCMAEVEHRCRRWAPRWHSRYAVAVAVAAAGVSALCSCRGIQGRAEGAERVVWAEGWTGLWVMCRRLPLDHHIVHHASIRTQRDANRIGWRHWPT